MCGAPFLKYKNLYVSQDNLSLYFSTKRHRPYQRTAKPFPLGVKKSLFQSAALLQDAVQRFSYVDCIAV